ncbi:MAG: adenylosuccinate lyase [Hadesarchaea archaeon]|nr:MAG: adenylosuccinate lyase [Hadesarchaea archaeon]
MSFDYSTFLSPFTWRYGSEEMRSLFSELEYRALWRKVWRALAEAQAEWGLISEEELKEIREKAEKEHIDLELSHRVEREIKHDLMAELKVFSQQCSKGGGKLHLGATSMDVEDNAEVLRMRRALDLLLTRLVNCLHALSLRIREHKDTICMGWTHLQPAEPTTLGYRLALYAQDLLIDLRAVEILLSEFLKGKGMKGAVGTSASFKRLLEGKARPEELEAKVMEKLGLPYFTVSGQTYPRKQDFMVLSVLAGIAQSAHKFGADLRHTHSPLWGEVYEPMGEKQVGSSAMPFKRNPVLSERMCSLARYVASLPRVAWENASHTLFERTLDDSANRRVILAEGFLAVDEILILYQHLVEGMEVNRTMIDRNLKLFFPFSALEPLLMVLVKKGGNRQELHERLRRLSSMAWERVREGGENPLPSLLKEDPSVGPLLTEEEWEEILDPSKHLGDAVERCERFLEREVAPVLAKYSERLGRKVPPSF